jgi:hypothetical protein
MNCPPAEPFWLDLAKWIALVWTLIGIVAAATWWAFTGFTIPHNAPEKRCEMDKNKA